MDKEKYIKCDCVDECSVLKVTELPVHNTKNVWSDINE